jgi:hypothetical protein
MRLFAAASACAATSTESPVTSVSSIGRREAACSALPLSPGMADAPQLEIGRVQPVAEPYHAKISYEGLVVEVVEVGVVVEVWHPLWSVPAVM